MAQATRTPGPGTTIEDANAAVLAATAAVTADVAVTWVQVDRPCDVAVVATLGVVDVGVTGFDIEVLGADDSSGTNPVSYGRFDTIAGAITAETRYLDVTAYKSYMGVIMDHTGSGDCNVGVKVHAIPHLGLSNTRTA